MCVCVNKVYIQLIITDYMIATRIFPGKALQMFPLKSQMLIFHKQKNKCKTDPFIK